MRMEHDEMDITFCRRAVHGVLMRGRREVRASYICMERVSRWCTVGSSEPVGGRGQPFGGLPRRRREHVQMSPAGAL